MQQPLPLVHQGFTKNHFLLWIAGLSGYIGKSAYGLIHGFGKEIDSMLAVLTHPIFWDKKVKIAILALATFAAMC